MLLYSLEFLVDFCVLFHAGASASSDSKYLRWKIFIFLKISRKAIIEKRKNIFCSQKLGGNIFYKIFQTYFGDVWAIIGNFGDDGQ